MSQQEKKVLFVASVDFHIKAFHLPYLKMFHDRGYQVHVAAHNTTKNFPSIACCDIFHDIEFSRSPFTSKTFKAYEELKQLLKTEHYDIIHCHTPVAGVMTRMAARNCKNTTVIYTAHGFHFYRGAPILNWLIYYPVEWFCARYTDKLITINKEDYDRVKHFKLHGNGKAYYVPGVGVNVKKYKDVRINRNLKRSELGVYDSTPIILSVGELIKRKNHETALRAMAKITDQHFVYLICGRGELLEQLKLLSQELGIADKVRFLGFRTDISEICKASDVFLFPSYQEGLPVAIMEAMSTGLPVIASNIRGNCDLIEDGTGGFLVAPNDVEGFSNKINFICLNKAVAIEMGNNNLSVVEKFDISNVEEIMRKTYNFLPDIRLNE